MRVMKLLEKQCWCCIASVPIDVIVNVYLVVFMYKLVDKAILLNFGEGQLYRRPGGRGEGVVLDSVSTQT